MQKTPPKEVLPPGAAGYSGSLQSVNSRQNTMPSLQLTMSGGRGQAQLNRTALWMERLFIVPEQGASIWRKAGNAGARSWV